MENLTVGRCRMTAKYMHTNSLLQIVMHSIVLSSAKYIQRSMCVYRMLFSLPYKHNLHRHIYIRYYAHNDDDIDKRIYMVFMSSNDMYCFQTA